MAFIVKGIVKGTIKETKPKRFLAIGPGPSAIEFLNSKPELESDIITIGLHRVYPLFNKSVGKTLDYWTWGDPHGAVEGLSFFEKAHSNDRPKIIVPFWMRTLSAFSKHSGTSPLTKGPKPNQETYHRVLKYAEDLNQIHYIENAVTTKLIEKNHAVFSNLDLRFKGENTYFSSAPFDGVLSNSKWTQENKLTSIILPICHYLGAEEVYCIGFDNKGGGISRKILVPYNDEIKRKVILWTKDWQPYHKMKIYNMSPSKHSPNSTFMETLPIESILK
jgi:hypothetical protein